MYRLRKGDWKKVKVQEVRLEGNQRRYLLVDNGLPVISVAKYLKYIDNSEKSFNTQKTYCYSLKLYFEYLQVIDVDYRKCYIMVIGLYIMFIIESIINLYYLKNLCQDLLTSSLSIWTKFCSSLISKSFLESSNSFLSCNLSSSSFNSLLCRFSMASRSNLCLERS